MIGRCALKLLCFWGWVHWPWTQVAPLYILHYFELNRKNNHWRRIGRFKSMYTIVNATWHTSYIIRFNDKTWHNNIQYYVATTCVHKIVWNGRIEHSYCMHTGCRFINLYFCFFSCIFIITINSCIMLNELHLRFLSF